MEIYSCSVALVVTHRLAQGRAQGDSPHPRACSPTAWSTDQSLPDGRCLCLRPYRGRGTKGASSHRLPLPPGLTAPATRTAISASRGPEGAVVRPVPDRSGGGRDVPGSRGPGGPGHVLVPCDRGTLYLRDVPDEVVRRLELLAVQRRGFGRGGGGGSSPRLSRRADNPVLLGSLPDLGLGTAMIVADLEAGRAGQ